jgi:hypothetical protein
LAATAAWRVRPTIVDRFPTRTLVLMVLTLVAFGWFWWQTHRRAAAASEELRLTPVVRLDGGAS